METGQCMTASVPQTLDVRPVPPRRKRLTVAATVDRLEPGESFVLVNDADPAPIREQVEGHRSSAFEWDYLECGPEVWRVRITRS